MLPQQPAVRQRQRVQAPVVAGHEHPVAPGGRRKSDRSAREETPPRLAGPRIQSHHAVVRGAAKHDRLAYDDRLRGEVVGDPHRVRPSGTRWLALMRPTQLQLGRQRFGRIAAPPRVRPVRGPVGSGQSGGEQGKGQHGTKPGRVLGCHGVVHENLEKAAAVAQGSHTPAKRRRGRIMT